MTRRRSKKAAKPRGSLDAGLAAAVWVAAGPDAEPVEVNRAPSPYTGISPSELVHVKLSSGEWISIFVKHLGDEQRTHPDKLLREREVRVYSELLAGRELPVPRFLGATCNEGTGRLELLLEHVDGWNLKYQGLPHWYSAARRLGQLHAVFAGQADRLLGADYLLRLDRDYLLAWAERAVIAVSSLSERLARRLQQTAKDLDTPTGLLAEQPPTLVHNDLAPKNVIAGTSTGGERTWIVDWEMAGVGCGLSDMAHLTHGLKPGETRRMLDIYHRELAGSGLAIAPSERRRVLASCQLHGTLYRLAHTGTWRLPAERVEEWIAEAERLNREAAR